MRGYLITIAILLSFFLGSNAQNSQKNKKNTLKYGYGSTFHSNEMLGRYQYGDYTRYFGKRVGLGLQGGYLKADNFTQTDNPSDYAFKAWKGEVNLYLLPISNSKTSLKIGGGGSYWMGEFQSKDTMEVDFKITDDENFGWNVIAEFEVYVVNTIVLGARAGYTQAIENKENYYFFGLNAGFKF